MKDAVLAELQARQAGNDEALASALRDRGRALNRLGRFQEALNVLLEAVAFVAPDDLAEQSRCWREAACAQRGLACDTEAQEYLGLALGLARRARATDVELDVLEDLAEAQAAHGEEQAAQRSLEACVTVRRTLPDHSGLARALVRLCEVAGRRAEHGAVQDHGAVREHGAIQDDQRLAWLEEALSHLHTEPPELRGVVEGEARAALARLLLQQGEAQQAKMQALWALGLLRGAGAQRTAWRVLPDLTQALLALGQPDLAWQEVQAALAAPTTPELLPERAGLHLAASEALEALGDVAGALAQFRLYHAQEAQRWAARTQERAQAVQARVGLAATQHEAAFHRERGDALAQTVQDRTAQLVRSQRAVIDLLAGAAEFRDAPLGAHARWVGDATTTVARSLGLDAQSAEELGLAARLHDVGKLAIPDAILLKDGPLTEDEWQVMHTHTTLGAQLLRQPGAADGGGPLLELAAQIALTHHEGWDGRGYPAGLAGETIPLGGRIVRVVDTFDALVTERPYKPAWTPARVLSYLTEHSGSLFDPHVVQAFAALHEQNALPVRS